jgi:hypothetical protein
VALIDWLRQYDIIKKMERMGKSVGMIAGQVRKYIAPLRVLFLFLFSFWGFLCMDTTTNVNPHKKNNRPSRPSSSRSRTGRASRYMRVYIHTLLALHCSGFITYNELNSQRGTDLYDTFLIHNNGAGGDGALLHLGARQVDDDRHPRPF